MGIIVTKDEDNSKLTERINADLRTKVQSTSDEDAEDFAENSAYLQDTEGTSRFSWIWLVLIILAIASLIFIILL